VHIRVTSTFRSIANDPKSQGLFYACKDGAEARRFNRLLIDAGLVWGL
jgi:hypothetical protein